MHQLFLNSVITRSLFYKDLGDKAFAQLDKNDFHFIPTSESNSIAVIIQHLHGNMLSRWTDCLSSDGEKEWRERDKEFEEQETGMDSLIQLWNDGWKCYLDALRSFKSEDLEKKILIRNETLNLTDAIIRQVAHYAYHVGQIVYIARMIKDREWQSLSIPRGRSKDFNLHKI